MAAEGYTDSSAGLICRYIPRLHELAGSIADRIEALERAEVRSGVVVGQLGSFGGPVIRRLLTPPRSSHCRRAKDASRQACLKLCLLSRALPMNALALSIGGPTFSARSPRGNTRGLFAVQHCFAPVVNPRSPRLNFRQRQNSIFMSTTAVMRVNSQGNRHWQSQLRCEKAAPIRPAKCGEAAQLSVDEVISDVPLDATSTSRALQAARNRLAKIDRQS